MNDEEDKPEADPLPRPRSTMLRMWFIALLVIVVGFSLSWWNVWDWLWLARAGSLVVALGIWSGLSILLGEQVFERTYELRRRLLVARARIRYRNDAVKRAEEIGALETWLDERLERHRGEHRISIGILEATLLIVGTLLWGFGNIIRYAF